MDIFRELAPPNRKCILQSEIQGTFFILFLNEPTMVATN